MEIIYSRNSFRFPRRFHKGNKIAKKRLIILLILAILLYIVFLVVNGIYPIFIKICQNKAHTMATKIYNEEVRQSYEKLYI